ncbi:MAG TPA: hypothetical protein VJJ52_04635 [Candidatus Nanoarchaeia archaeon]|nr:hypothetical protein [Candidatus Nanoarchaeia archaeon]
MDNEKKNSLEKLCFGILIAVVFIMGFNAYQISQLKHIGNSVSGMNDMNTATRNSMANLAASTKTNLSITPKGIPEIYGGELEISYDDVSAADQKKADATIKKLGMLDQQITLNGDDLKRYISVAGQISCEYCCGTDSIIFPDGKAACGCQHSFAMRGVAKYLIKNHPADYTDDGILEELSKWKILFFPEQMAKKAAVMESKGIELNPINLASNKYRNIEN